MSKIAQIWGRVQAVLFPHLERCLDEPLTDKQRRVAAILEVVRVEQQVPAASLQWIGRPPQDRRAVARAFVVKAVYNLPTTKLLVEMLRTQANLRRICGWEYPGEVPSESTFSRGFAEFAAGKLADRVHEALVAEHFAGELVCHISRDATEIEAREKPRRKPPQAPQQPKRRGRPGKGELRERQLTRLEKQVTQTAQEALAQLPTACDVGTKRNSQGYQQSWIGYKLHLDVADGGLPTAALTTSASLHDSQAAVPLEKLSASRVTSLYALMDRAYDAKPIRQVCRELEHVPIIDVNGRGKKVVGFDPAAAVRYRERTTVERVYGRLKDEFGGRQVWVRGHCKVHAHLMFGVIALFADQLLKLAT